MSVFRHFPLLLTGLLFFSQDLEAQSHGDSLGSLTLSNIDTWRIHSSTIGEDYELYVLRTTTYDTTKVRLPVLFMTDGDWNMTVAMNCFSMLRQDYATREPLIVGIGYGKGQNKRVRDLDPENGGPNFLAFIEKEVIPFINSTYRTTDEKAIYGYSMGGMFTTYILFNRPELFDMVFIGAPGNNGRQLMPSARQYFKKHTDLKGRVFVGVGGYEKEVVMNIDSLKNFLLSRKCPSLKIRTDITPGANHGAALAQVMQNAIAFGYCERRQRASVDPVVFSKYVGIYASKDKTVPNAVFTVEKNELIMKWQEPGSIPIELIPQSSTEYFMVEDERVLFTFRKEGNKLKLVAFADNKEYHFERKE